MKSRFSAIWEQVRKEKGLLILCFILAFLAWQGIRKNIGFEVSVSDIVVDVDVPEGWAVWEKSLHRVNVLFRGSREDIRYLNNEKLRVVIPVADPKTGEEVHLKLSGNFLKNPTGAKVVQFSPSEIIFKLDQESERLLPVKATLEGGLPEGLEIDKIVCNPASVSVTGARRVLDQMESIHTAPIDLKNRQASFKESVPVELQQESRMQVYPDWVSVEFSLMEHASTQILENVPVKLLCSAGDRRRIEVTPKTVNVTVRGQHQQVEQIQEKAVFAFVSCSDLTENTTYNVPVLVDLPADIEVIQTDPAVVSVQISNLK